MFVSIILSTYNAPHWLQKVLWGYARQSHQEFEIVVADDGSKAATAELIDAMRRETGLAIRHVWQRDDGFRKCRILNKAVLHASAEYLIFSDGDCIPREDFLAAHVAAARPERYLSGGYCKLSLATSQVISKDQIDRGDCFDLSWLRAHGHRVSRKDLKLWASPRMAPWLNALTTTRCNFKGSNGSAWLSDVVAVNGFDERMAYGSEDREFGVRLRNLGRRPCHVRYTAICVHLDHPRGYVDATQYDRNRALRKHNQRYGITRTEHGIAQLLAAGYQPEIKGLAVTHGLL